MRKFKYQIVEYDNTEEQLNNYGENGWRVVQVINNKMIIEQEIGLETNVTEEIEKAKIIRNLSDDERQRRSQQFSRILSKPVVCLNNGHHYGSMQEAAILEYKHRRSYNYIGEVCNHKRSHYKKDIWMYEEEYQKLSEFQIQQMINNVINEEIGIVTLFMFNGKKYYKQAKILDDLQNYGYNCSRQAFNEKKVKAEKTGINCFRLIGENQSLFVYFTEYYQLKQDGVIIEEYPVERSLEELQVDYEKILSMKFGDCTGEDILFTNKDFYRFNGTYYKSVKSVEECYDEIPRESVFYYYYDNDFVLDDDLFIEDIENSKQKTFYVFGNTIYKTRQRLIEKTVKTLTKPEVVDELMVIVYK